jgi:hypothetical protein
MFNYTVRRLEKKNLESRVEWCNTREIYSQMYLNIPFSLSETESWFSSILLDESRDDFSIFDHNELIAMCGITDIDLKDGNCQLYIMVDPEKTGQGIGTSVIHWLCNYTFNKYDLKNFIFKLVDYVPPNPGCAFCVHKKNDDGTFFYCDKKEKTLSKELKTCKVFRQRNLYYEAE